MNKLYKVDWIVSDYEYEYQMGSITFCGIFDTKEKAEAYAKEIEQSGRYALISSVYEHCKIYIKEIELNKRYWKE